MNQAGNRIIEAITTAGVVLWRAVVSFRYNWGLAILALALAASLWVFVTDQDDPEVTGRVPGSIPVECVNVPLGKAAAPPCGETKSVTVRVRAPESVLDDLDPEDFQAFADLADATADNVVVPVRIESTEPRVEVLEISPSQITVQLEDVTFRTVPVRAKLVGTPPRGFEVNEIATAPEAAIITGATSLVGRVEAVEVDVNLTGERASFQQTLILQARDEQGGNVQGVNIEPDSADVSVEIEQLESTSAIAVRPEITGIPASGFSVDAIEIEPPIVNVTGTTAVFQILDPVQGVSTAPLSIDGATADVVRTVGLELPEGATVDQDQITVRVVITPTDASLTFEVDVGVENAAGSSVDLAPDSVRVTLTGSLSALAGVTAANIDASVDLAGLSLGEHVVEVEVTPPAGLTPLLVSPEEITVTLTQQ